MTGLRQAWPSMPAFRTAMLPNVTAACQDNGAGDSIRLHGVLKVTACGPSGRHKACIAFASVDGSHVSREAGFLSMWNAQK